MGQLLPEPEDTPQGTPQAASAPWLDALSAAGLDTRSGLATAMNNPALYQRLLLRFHEGQRDFAALFAAAQAEVQAGTDPQAAQRCAHTLRGTAATIGAKRLREAADRLDRSAAVRRIWGDAFTDKDVDAEAVRARMTDDPAAYPWSSCPAASATRKPPPSCSRA